MTYSKSHLRPNTQAHQKLDGALDSDLEFRMDNDTSDTLLIEDPECDFPEGGITAWVTVFGSFFGLASSFGLFNSTGAIETYISINQLNNVSSFTIGWVFSIYLCVSLLCGIFTGDLFDSKGPRIPILFGGILEFVGFLATGYCTKTYQFILALGIVGGLGVGFQVNALLGIISHYFNKRRGLAVGIATIGGSFGGAIFPIILRKLYTVVGFTQAMVIFSIIVLVLDLLAFAFCKPRFPPKKVLYSMDGEYSIKSFAKTVYKFFTSSLDIQAFRDPRFLYCALGTACAETFLCCIITYFGQYIVANGFSEDKAYLMITIQNAMGIGARVGAGYVADKLGKFNVALIMVLVSSVLCLVIWLPFGRSITGLYLFTVFFGISSCGVLSLLPVCISQISRVEDFGLRYSMAYFVAAFGTLVGVPISGLFIGKNPIDRNYDNYIIFCACMGFAACIFFFLSRYYAVKLRLCIY